MIGKFVSALLLVLGSALAVWFFQEGVLDLMDRGRHATFGTAPQQEPSLSPTERKTLFFADVEQERLIPYPVDVEIGKDHVETLGNVLKALLDGPKRGGYAPILPKGTKLRVVFPGQNATAYVDFDKTLRTEHPGGAWAELMTAYGVAGTVIRSFPEFFERVVLLIDGQEAQSIAGSLAITGPLTFREELFAQGALPAEAGAEGEAGAAGTPSGGPRNSR